jgi:hypothetical protein
MIHVGGAESRIRHSDAFGRSGESWARQQEKKATTNELPHARWKVLPFNRSFDRRKISPSPLF